MAHRSTITSSSSAHHQHNAPKETGLIERSEGTSERTYTGQKNAVFEGFWSVQTPTAEKRNYYFFFHPRCVPWCRRRRASGLHRRCMVRSIACCFGAPLLLARRHGLVDVRYRLHFSIAARLFVAESRE